MIDEFGRVTLDPDPMHVDPVWSAKFSPFGRPVAFGFLTMSLLTHLAHDALGTNSRRPPGDAVFLNYGFDRLRLVAPVPSGARIRGHFEERTRVQDDKGRWRVGFDCRIEIEGQEKPALVARWLSVLMPPPR
jgi:acyl dehydratase